MSFDASIRVPIALPGGATEDALESIMSDGESTTSSQPPAIASTAKETDIYRDERFSDHAPLTVVYDFDLK